MLDFICGLRFVACSYCSVGLALPVTALFFFSFYQWLSCVMLGGVRDASLRANFRAFAARWIGFDCLQVGLSAAE